MSNDKKPTRQGFDFVVHEGVADMRKDGLWTYLGERFGDLEVRLRPFYEEAVVVRKEASEAAKRMTLGLEPGEPLPGEAGLDVNRDAVTMAITGARGAIRANAEMLEIARAQGWNIEDDEWIILTGKEEAEHVRAAFSVMMSISMHLMSTLVKGSRGLHTVPDKEIHAVGKDFIYGKHVRQGWAD